MKCTRQTPTVNPATIETRERIPDGNHDEVTGGSPVTREAER
jgi:hypothetical protein